MRLFRRLFGRETNVEVIDLPWEEPNPVETAPAEPESPPPPPSPPPKREYLAVTEEQGDIRISVRIKTSEDDDDWWNTEAIVEVILPDGERDLSIAGHFDPYHYSLIWDERMRFVGIRSSFHFIRDTMQMLEVFDLESGERVAEILETWSLSNIVFGEHHVTGEKRGEIRKARLPERPGLL